MKIGIIVTEYLSLATNKPGATKDLVNVLNDHLNFLFSAHYDSITRLQLIISLNVMLNKVVSAELGDLPYSISSSQLIAWIKNLIRCVDDKKYYDSIYLELKDELEEWYDAK